VIEMTKIYTDVVTAPQSWILLVVIRWIFFSHCEGVWYKVGYLISEYIEVC